MAPFDNDCIIQIMLHMIFPSFSKLSEKLYGGHHPGGIYYGVSKESRMFNVTRSVPKHNKFGESAFAYIGDSMKCKPRMCYIV